MRITLGSLQAADTLAVSVAMMAPPVSSWLSTFPYPYTEFHREEADGTQESADWAIRADGRFVGIILAAPELGCWIDQKFQGSGIATRASVLALTRLFTGQTNYSYARYLSQNQPMKALLERLGYRPDTSIPSTAHRQDLALLRLCRDDFCLAQPVVLDSARLRILPIGAEDHPALYQIATNPKVAVSLPFFYPGLSPMDFAAAMTPFSGQPPFWCKVQMGDHLIGAIGLAARQIGGKQQMFIQSFLSPTVWGLGIGAEAITTFTQELQDRFGLTSVYAECFADEDRVAEMLEHIGFIRDPEPVQLTGAQRHGAGHRFRLDLHD